MLALGIHIYVNGVLKQFPPENPTPTELEAYLQAEAGTWAIVHGLKYLALVGLIFFAAGMHAKTGGNRGLAGWGTIGLLGTAVHVTNALVANGIEITAFYDFSRLSNDPALFWLLFHTVRTLFTAELVAWGLVIFGFSMAGLGSGTLPRWLSILGFGSSAACMLSGVFVVSVLTDGWAVAPMDVASLSGLLWFASSGIYLLLKGNA